jgi:hypothetical protein
LTLILFLSGRWVEKLLRILRGRVHRTLLQVLAGDPFAFPVVWR